MTESRPAHLSEDPIAVAIWCNSATDVDDSNSLAHKIRTSVVTVTLTKLEAELLGAFIEVAARKLLETGNVKTLDGNLAVIQAKLRLASALVELTPART